jgi:hypothetical protein
LWFGVVQSILCVGFVLPWLYGLMHYCVYIWSLVISGIFLKGF